MKKGGYPTHSAAAIEAVASTGGQLMPPMMGVAAFVMAELLQIGYAEVVIAALIPAILYYAALFIQVDLQAARDGILPIEKSLIPRLLPVVGRGGIFLTPFVVIVLCLFRWTLQPETAALYAALTLLPIGFLLGYGGDRLSLDSLVASFVKTGKAGLELLMIGGAAGAIIGVLNISALGFALTSELVGIAGGSLVVLLILAAFVCILLGMGMPTLGVYILLATLVAPAIIELGVPDLSAHLFVMYFGMMSMITPPVAIAAFAAATAGRRADDEDRLAGREIRLVGLSDPLRLHHVARAHHAGRRARGGAELHDRAVRCVPGLGSGDRFLLYAHSSGVSHRLCRCRPGASIVPIDAFRRRRRGSIWPAVPSARRLSPPTW